MRRLVSFGLSCVLTLAWLLPAIGRAVTAHAGVSLVRGHLARVDVRMNGSTPMLALTVRIAQDKPSPEERAENDREEDWKRTLTRAHVACDGAAEIACQQDCAEDGCARD